MSRLILNQISSPVEKPNIISVLQNIITTREKEIDTWFAEISSKSPLFFYNSVDLRHSGHKLAPVDTNLFPAGFNNLNTNERLNAVKKTKEFFAKYFPDVQNVLIFAEDHTRNTYYLDNIAVLIDIITEAGKNVELSNLATSQSGTPNTLTSQSGHEVTFKPVIKKDNLLQTTDGFVPDFVLVNNDLTDGAPELLLDIKQHVSPPIGLGWFQRRKTSHFDTYNNMAREFCDKFEIDPWLISTYFQRCGLVNFHEKTGLECVALRVDQTIAQIQKKYDEYGIDEAPYVFIKSDRGTYGMGIMTAKSGEEVLEIGKDIRKKMNTIKGGVQNTEVIIQEGIPTIDRVDDNPAEPMIYILGGEPVGCMYRLNTKKDSYGNLNASGMGFVSIASQSNDKQMCKSVALIAKLAAYASSWECYVESYNI
jgi:glutamate--cysteine ligase